MKLDELEIKRITNGFLVGVENEESEEMVFAFTDNTPGAHAISTLINEIKVAMPEKPAEVEPDTLADAIAVKEIKPEPKEAVEDVAVAVEERPRKKKGVRRKTCPNCGNNENRSWDNECRNCGHDITDVDSRYV